jgi:hypothetical protein
VSQTPLLGLINPPVPEGENATETPPKLRATQSPECNHDGKNMDAGAPIHPTSEGEWYRKEVGMHCEFLERARERMKKRAEKALLDAMGEQRERVT